MKKVYLLVSGLLLTAGAVNAQISTETAYLPIQKAENNTRTTRFLASDRAPGEVLVSDDFSDASNWIIYTEGGTAPVWEITNTEPENIYTYLDTVATTTEANGFGLFNGIDYLLTGTVEPSNALLEYGSAINCSSAGAVILEFEQVYRAFNRDDVFVEVSNDDWATSESWQINESAPTNGPTIHSLVAINISTTAAGESNVKIRFKWLEEEGDASFGMGYGWAVDDFKVREAWNNDLRISEGFFRSGIGVTMDQGIGYHTMSINQTTGMTFIAEMTSDAGTIQTGAKANVLITGAATFSSSSASVDLGIGGSDSLACAAEFTPVVIGDYNAVIYVDSDGAEDVTFNDSIYTSFTLTNNVYGIDNGIATGSISNVTSNTNLPLTIGNQMDIFATDVIDSVRIAITNADENAGQLIYGLVMIYDEVSGAYIYADQTSDYEILDADLGGFITLGFDDPISVTAGQSILLLAGHYGGTDEVAFRTSVSVGPQVVLGFTSGATDPFSLLSPRAVMIRLVLEPSASIGDEVNNNFAVSQNMPNPFGDNAVINYELNEAANVSIEFVDISGKVVKSINNGNQTAGVYTLDVDANEFAEGVYFYTFTVGTQRITKKMVITK